MSDIDASIWSESFVCFECFVDELVSFLISINLYSELSFSGAYESLLYHRCLDIFFERLAAFVQRTEYRRLGFFNYGQPSRKARLTALMARCPST